MARVRDRIKKDSKAADKLYEDIYGKPGDPPVAAAAPAPVEEVPVAAVPEPAPPVETPAEEVKPTEEVKPAEPEPSEPEPVDFEQKFNTLSGKYNAELPQLRAELQNTQQMLNDAASNSADFGDMGEAPGITKEEVEEYGEELIDIVRRAARAEFAPVVQQLQKQNEDLQNRLQQTSTNIQEGSRASLLSTLRQAIPDWEKQNNEPGFLDWLSQTDLYSGTTKQQLLLQAFEANDTNRVIAFFRGYKPEQTGQPTPAPAISEAPSSNGLETLVAPGRPAGTADTGAQKSGRIWTEAEIQAYSQNKRRGAYSEKEAAHHDAEIHTAGMEGRIRP